MPVRILLSRIFVCIFSVLSQNSRTCTCRTAHCSVGCLVGVNERQELEEKENEIEFYKDQERVHQEEILAYQKVEASNHKPFSLITCVL